MSSTSTARKGKKPIPAVPAVNVESHKTPCDPRIFISDNHITDREHDEGRKKWAVSQHGIYSHSGDALILSPDDVVVTAETLRIAVLVWQEFFCPRYHTRGAERLQVSDEQLARLTRQTVNHSPGERSRWRRERGISARTPAAHSTATRKRLVATSESEDPSIPTATLPKRCSATSGAEETLDARHTTVRLTGRPKQRPPPLESDSASDVDMPNVRAKREAQSPRIPARMPAVCVKRETQSPPIFEPYRPGPRGYHNEWPFDVQQILVPLKHGNDPPAMSVDVVRYLLRTENGRLSNEDRVNLTCLLARLLQRQEPVDSRGRPVPELAAELIQPRTRAVPLVDRRISTLSAASSEYLWQVVEPFLANELELADALLSAFNSAGSIPAVQNDNTVLERATVFTASEDLASISSASSLSATLPPSSVVSPVDEDADSQQVWGWLAHTHVLIPHSRIVAALNQGLSVDVLNEDMMRATIPPDDRRIIANPKTKHLYPASKLHQALSELCPSSVLGFCKQEEATGYLAAPSSQWLAGPGGFDSF